MEFSPECLTLPFFFFKVWTVGWKDVRCLRGSREKLGVKARFFRVIKKKMMMYEAKGMNQWRT